MNHVESIQQIDYFISYKIQPNICDDLFRILTVGKQSVYDPKSTTVVDRQLARFVDLVDDVNQAGVFWELFLNDLFLHVRFLAEFNFGNVAWQANEHATHYFGSQKVCKRILHL